MSSSKMQDAIYTALPTATQYNNTPMNVSKLKRGKYTLFHLNKMHPEKEAKKVSKSKSKLTRREKEKLNLVKINHDHRLKLKYAEFESLRQLWHEYISNLSNKLDFNKHFLKMDLHGAELYVIRSKCPSLVSLSGTCVFDTKNTFQILTREDKIKVIPKETCVFRILNAPPNKSEIEFFGKQFMIRPSERSSKKVKKFARLDT